MKEFFRKLSRYIPDKPYIMIKWLYRMRYWFNLNNPKTFNEKLQWLKVYYRRPDFTTMVDKYAVKEYVAKIVGGDKIIPTIGVWKSFDEIDFDALPNQFVLKCTHDSGGIVICRDKKQLNYEKAKKRINASLATNYYYHTREFPYKDVKPRIIAEELLTDDKTKDLRDYKFFCFNGVVRMFKIDFDRFTDHHANYYDPNGILLPFGEANYPPVYNRKLEMPTKLDEMKILAEKLSSGIPFVRVDFYEVNDKVYFGELTFFPAAGCSKYTDMSWDKKMGEWLVLPQKY